MCKPSDSAPSGVASVEVAAEDAWIPKLDLKNFGRDIRELGNTLKKQQGDEDDAHLYKLIRWQTGATVIGLGTMWMASNPITVFCLSLGLFMRWAMIGHHVCHNGYRNTEAGKTKGFNQFVFAVGSVVRRLIDWCDWMLPEAWNLEHGRLHHYSLNEEDDPDLVQLNGEYIQKLPLPMWVKYAMVATIGLTWKWSYYAPNTFSELLLSRKLSEASLRQDSAAKEALLKEKAGRRSVMIWAVLEGDTPSWWSSWGFFTNVLAPFLILRFVLVPAPIYFLLGRDAFVNAMINLLLAELLTNAHSFLAIVPNHAGADLYHFDSHVEPLSDEFFLRQVIGSVDFNAGSDVIDTSTGFLNYQIEHHLWPDLSMRSYQKAHPLVKDICAKYGVPFVQENVFSRLYKTVRVLVGQDKMRPFPQHLLATEHNK